MTAAPPIHSDETPPQPPFAGYDRLSDGDLVHVLHEHTQGELAAVETYERAHKSREAVLNKLRYLRGDEPLLGYDALSDEEILAAVETADMATLKKIRGYERKFRARPPVLDATVRLQHARRDTAPATAPPSYQPASANGR